VHTDKSRCVRVARSLTARALYQERLPRRSPRDLRAKAGTSLSLVRTDKARRVHSRGGPPRRSSTSDGRRSLIFFIVYSLDASLIEA